MIHVVLIGRHQVPYPFNAHTLDYPVLRGWADGFSRLDVIVQGGDLRWRIWREGNLVVHYAPRLPTLCSRAGFMVLVLRRLIALARRGHVDVVTASDLWGGAIAIVARRVIGARVIAQLQGEFFPPSDLVYGRVRRLLMYQAARFIARRADLVRCLYHQAATAVQGLGVESRRIAVVPSRCDVDRFDPSRWENVRRESGSVLYVGRLVRGKGVDVLVRAMGRVVRQVPHATLVIVGSGPEEASLRRLADDLALESRVRFVGQRPHDELPLFYARAAAFACPSFSEATPRAVLEAMAMSLPVVATRVGGMPEIVIEGRTGFLVPAGDPSSLAEALERILLQPNWCVGAGEVGREQVEARYSTARQVEQMVALHYGVASGLRRDGTAGEVAVGGA